MKILFVRTYSPHCILYGSEMRARYFVDYLRSKGEVDLLTLTKSTDEQVDKNYIKEHFRKHFYFDQEGQHIRLTRAEKFLHLLPWQITEHYAKDFQKTLSLIIEENQYDLIFVFKFDPVFYFLQLPEKWREKVIIDIDDVFSDLYMNYHKKSFTSFKNRYSLKLIELKAITQFKRAFVCSQDAISKIHPYFRHKISVVPNIFQSDRRNFLPAAKDRSRLLYVGSLDYFPNIEGLKWFFEFIWPDFKKTYPDVKLTVIGKYPKDKRHILTILNHPRDIEIEINVLDVKPYYQDSFAVIVPLLNASGTRLKILESASYGRPVITTPKGVEGLDFEDKKNIFLFKNTSSFTEAYQNLFEGKRYSQVIEDAWQILKENYSHETFSSQMNKNWELIEL